MVYVLKYDADQRKLTNLPYYVPTNVIAEEAGISSPNHPSVVGVLPQPCSQGNRVLIAYVNGLIVIWDVSDDKVVLVRGNKDLQVQGETASGSPENKNLEVSDCVSESDKVEKEISSLCWASNDGSILAVGYVDGDIMFWALPTATSKNNQQASKSHKNVVKLQLSSGEKRLPAIVLHWSENQSHSAHGCKIFFYGGDQIGSKETLTILDLEWPSGIESLKCVSHVDITPNGSFADMVLFPTVGEMENGGSLLFVLTNPGQLHVYDDACLAAFKSQDEKKPCVSSGQYVMPIPIVAPCMTVSKLSLVDRDGEFSKALSKIVSSAKVKAPHTPIRSSKKWPLTGGIPSRLPEAADYEVERVYMAGYQDGSVRMWDATYPALSLIFVLGAEIYGKVPGIDIAGASAPVSALEICSFTQSVSIGNECGMVCLFKLTGTSNEMSLNIVTETEKKVHTLHQADGPQCMALFSLFSSPVCLLQSTEFGNRLAVGFKCGRVAMLDVGSPSVLFITDSLSRSNCSVSSLAMISFTDTNTLINNSKDSTSTSLNDGENGLAFIMTRDAYLAVLDGRTGHMVSSQSIPQKKESKGANIVSSTVISESKNEPAHSSTDPEIAPVEPKSETAAQVAYLGQRSKSLLILLCFEDALHLHSLKSVIKGTCDSIREVNLKQCCWTSAVKIDDKECGLVLLCRTGIIEIRSLTKLEVMGQCSLMTILRWNFTANMEKMACSSNRGQIVLINGCEFAAVSILALENDFRIPDSLPCFHDTVLAAAFDATVKSEDTSPGILGGIFKGLIGGKQDRNMQIKEACRNDFPQLESIFSSPPFLKPSTASTDDKEVINLNIDDILIDEKITVFPKSETINNDEKNKKPERERLFEGSSTDAKPTVRSVYEIRAKYRGPEDAAAAAARARDRLIERQEKLERINDRSQELQNEAENFASIAHQLARKMEKKKWWNI
ncbi:lethal(2) giant larvae protein-like protein 1-like isoform X3 [Gossypium australe]|uniref:Lethal(2) giant larvae protein-like protein 1-like isoform X3 n=1 Tax=Gossypium australe TaxID=47621 RepID=A0A5B6V4U4_9ROSI|nr:lethal(2) giant larvae protein-like protein 1-like isoform X3 [Gossypium australe]